MEIKINNIGLNHPFFDFVSADDKVLIAERLKNNTSFIIDVDEKCGAVIDIENDRIHARQIGGQLVKHVKYIDKFCEAFAKLVDKKMISFVSEIGAVIYKAEKMGFKLHHDGDYIREI